MANILDFEYMKYQKEFLENEGCIDYTSFVNEIQFHESYTPKIREIVNCLFCNTFDFISIDLYSFLYEIENANVNEEVKEMIVSIYKSNDETVKNNTSVSNHKYYSREIEVIQSTFPPQVLKFFEALLENPNKMTKFDIVAILGIIRDTRISVKLNEYIDSLIDISNIETEEEFKKIFDDESEYTQSLFKKYIH